MLKSFWVVVDANFSVYCAVKFLQLNLELLAVSFCSLFPWAQVLILLEHLAGWLFHPWLCLFEFSNICLERESNICSPSLFQDKWPLWSCWAYSKRWADRTKRISLYQWVIQMCKLFKTMFYLLYVKLLHPMHTLANKVALKGWDRVWMLVS